MLARIAIVGAMLVLIGVVAVVLAYPAGAQAPPFDPYSYDENEDGVIDVDELIQATLDHFADLITAEDLREVLIESESALGPTGASAPSCASFDTNGDGRVSNPEVLAVIAAHNADPEGTPQSHVYAAIHCFLPTPPNPPTPTHTPVPDPPTPTATPIVIQINPGGGGGGSRPIPNLPRPQRIVYDHQRDNTAQWRRGTINNAIIDSVLDRAAAAWNNAALSLGLPENKRPQICTSSHSGCKTRNTDNVVGVVRTVARLSGCRSIACNFQSIEVIPPSTRKGHIIREDIQFEDPPIHGGERYEWTDVERLHEDIVPCRPGPGSPAITCERKKYFYATYAATHEFGHSFGLEDWYRDSTRVMGEALRITQLDRNSLREIYLNHARH